MSDLISEVGRKFLDQMVDNFTEKLKQEYEVLSLSDLEIVIKIEGNSNTHVITRLKKGNQYERTL